MQLSIIIVNYNVKYFLEQCLLSVIKAIKNIEAEIIVIDNNSTDDSYAFFKKFEEVNFTWNETNCGFSKANNQALKIASGEYILFLNPDTIIPEDCFEKCILFIKNNNSNGALGIKMLDGSGHFLKESKRAFPSPVTSLYKISGLTALFPHSPIFARYHLGHLSENENHEVDVLAGAFMMIPKKILDIAGGFDEEFFMYGEDIDLSFRIQKAGFKNYYFSESSILHFKGESTKKGSLNYVKLFYKAMSIFVKKHYGNTSGGLFNLLIQVAIFFRAGLAAIARFLKWISLPVSDAAIILISFWIINLPEGSFTRPEIYYSPSQLYITFPVFGLLFLGVAYFTRLFGEGIKQSGLNKSAITAILAFFLVYSLFPASLSFSKGILLSGLLLSFAFMTGTRQLLLKWKIIGSSKESGEINRTLIAGTYEEFIIVSGFIEKANKKERILGRIETGDLVTDSATMGTFNRLNAVLQQYPVKEIIFCEGSLSFKKIIETVPAVPHPIRVKIFANGSHAIIGSDDKDAAGNFIGTDENYRLESAMYRRSKNYFDITASLFFLIFSPFLFFTKKKPLVFFNNALMVLIRKKTWVGYATTAKDLPALPPGVITTTGRPLFLNSWPIHTLAATDELYAKQYHVLLDIKLVWKGYRWLS